MLSLFYTAGATVRTNCPLTCQSIEDCSSVNVAEDFACTSLRVRHHTEDVASTVQNARNTFRRAVWSAGSQYASVRFAVGEGDSVFCLEHVERVIVRDVPALVMGDMDLERPVDSSSPPAICVDGLQMHLSAEKPTALVSDQSAGQDAGFREDLEPIANADDRLALFGKPLDLGYDRGESGYRSASQVIAISEPSGNHDRLEAIERGVSMPDVFCRHPDRVSQRVQGVLVAVASRGSDNRYFQAGSSIS